MGPIKLCLAVLAGGWLLPGVAGATDDRKPFLCTYPVSGTSWTITIDYGRRRRARSLRRSTGFASLGATRRTASSPIRRVVSSILSGANGETTFRMKKVATTLSTMMEIAA